MNGRFDENELLGFIEGDLPSTRALEIERALKADRGLAATLDAMRRDRTMLRAEFARMIGQSGGRAPHRTVQEAIEAAERDAILEGIGEARSSGVLARIGFGRGLAAAASIGLLLAGGALVWNTMNPAPPRQIGGQQAAAISGAEDAIRAMDAGAMELASAATVTDEQVDEAIQLAQHTHNERAALRTMARTATATPAALRTWNDLHSDVPVLPSRVPTRITGNDLPLAEIVEALDKARIDWSKWNNEVLTLAVAGRSRAFMPARYGDLPEAAPASYEDALRLAGLNRLSLRVVAEDPSAVEQELFRLAAQEGMTVRLKNRGDACGGVEYSVEMPRSADGMEALVDAVCGCEAPQSMARRTFFDVSLLPLNAAGDRTLQTPVQITDGPQRVSVPVLIERPSAR